MKKVSDEELLAAIMKYGTVREASAATGCAARTIYDRMHERAFKAMYRAARADILRGAAAGLNGRIEKAVETIAAILDDEEAPHAVKLQAANAILAHAEKFSSRLTDAEDGLITTEPKTLAEMLEDI